MKINNEVSIPSAFHECEKNGRIDNFALAAGLIKGEQKGDFPFDDTDVYKIIEGSSYSLALVYDKKLDSYLDSLINLISLAQEPDGYLTTCVTNKCERLSGWWGSHKWEKLNSHELYNSGHLYEAAVAHYQATGKKSLLNVAIKNANLVCKVFGPNENQKHVPSGHPIVEMALCKLYKVTHNEQYLKTAKYFIEETGRGTDGHKLSEYSQDYMPILQQTEIKGHAVRAGYLYSGVADVASLTNDNGYFNALESVWTNLVSKKLYITGGMGSRPQGEGFGPNYELNNHTCYCETCASIANVFWNQRMFLATGDAKYVDVLERAMYNGVISGVSLSGDKFFYDNPLESIGEHSRQKWFGCACCPGNITRFMPSIPKYVYAKLNNDIYVNLYIQSKSNVKIKENDINLIQVTDYPWDGKVQLIINPSNESKFTVNLRVPGWAQGAPVPSDLYTFADSSSPISLALNGNLLKYKIKKGYISLDRKWKKGDKIELILPMQVRKIIANQNVEDDRYKVALQRGPIVYCLEGIDQKDKHVFNKYIDIKENITFSYDKGLLNGIGVLNGICKSVSLNGEENKVLFKAIPYSTWANRGSDEMEVWIPTKASEIHSIPKPTIASKAQAFSISTPIQKGATNISTIKVPAWGVNDQFEPKRSSDISKPYFYWWLKKGTKESLSYKFDKTYKVSSVDVYWLDFDHYDCDFRVPLTWKLYYKNGKQWKAVSTSQEYTIKKDCYNHLTFTPVKTNSLKITAQLQKGKSGGIIEWKVN